MRSGTELKRTLQFNACYSMIAHNNFVYKLLSLKSKLLSAVRRKLSSQFKNIASSLINSMGKIDPKWFEPINLMKCSCQRTLRL